MVDFTDPAASDWWNGMAHPLYRQGVAFFKNDDGEYLPEDGRSANGMQGDEYHNIYGFYYGKAMYEGMHPPIPAGEGSGRETRGLIYARSVWSGSQRFPAVFLGDQKPTFDHIRASLRAGLNMGLAGFAYWTADVFGLDGKTSPEIHMRYAQWALLNPVARYFLRPPQIDATRFPWSHGAEVESNFRKYTELRYRLLPYYYSLAWEAYRAGIPIIRPMLLEFPDNPRFADCADQYMLGDRLLVAPVVTAGEVQRKIVLPAGIWHDFWSGQAWQGPAEIEYPAALDCLPILVRGGRILPLGPLMQHIPDDHRFEQLELHLYPPLPAECLLYDDDGVTTAYRDGDYTLVRVRAEGTGSRPEVRTVPVAGRMEWQPKFSLIVHGA
jgi:alpha-glucosidase